MSRVRALVLIAVAALLAGLFGATASPAGAASVSRSHPYSDPVYYPLRVPANVECVKHNPGCKAPHGDWMMDMVPTGQNHGTSHAGVYAMGAGIVHYGNAHGASCGKENSYGTWIWIDHGAGVVSRYGHLSRISAHSGQYVAAGQQIGVVGTTGKRQNCHIAYTDFAVQHKGLKVSHGVEMKSLYACTSRGRQSWPKAASGHATWNQTPTGTEMPASSGNCIPGNANATPAAPTRLAIARGKGKLRLGLARPAASSHANSVMIEMAQYHPSTHAYDLPRNSRWIFVSPSKTSLLVSKLARNKVYRVRVYVHNNAGWSAPITRTAKTKK